MDDYRRPDAPDEFATQEIPRIYLARPGTVTEEAPREPRHGAPTGTPAEPERPEPGPPFLDEIPDEDTDEDTAEDDTAEDGTAGDEEPAGTPRPERWRTVVGGLGELMLTGGLVVLLFVVYELFITDLFTARDQSRLADTLHATWQATPAAAPEIEPAVGAPVAVVHIPRLGSDYQRVIVEGTDQTQLAQGPGHYVGAAMPGQQGNFALAGHRVGKGSPFLDLDTMRPGDAIVVETATQWYVYRVLGDAGTGSVTSDPSGIPGLEVVQPTALDVISPTPDSAAGTPASGAYLTITTCNPKFSARTRLVVHARLDGAPVSKASAPKGPSALRGT